MTGDRRPACRPILGTPPAVGTGCIRTRRVFLARGVYALIGGLMVSCTSNQHPDGKNIITVTPAPTYVGPLHFQVLETRDTLLGPHPVRWESWTMVSQNELEFLVGSGLAECQAARVHLTELADEVRVGIEVGSIGKGSLPVAPRRTGPAPSSNRGQAGAERWRGSIFPGRGSSRGLVAGLGGAPRSDADTQGGTGAGDAAPGDHRRR